MDHLENIKTLGAFLIMGVVVALVIGPVIFGVVAGNKGYQDHRLRKETCNTLLRENNYDDYVRVCKSIDIVYVQVDGDEVPDAAYVVLPREETN